jgi:sugar phosphate isomerase/epimerase
MAAVELSALRIQELPLLVDALADLNLDQFTYVALHAPSRFGSEMEDGVISLLRQVPKAWPIIVHPDTIHDFRKWAEFGGQLAIENMDRRKSDGRSADELERWFDLLPNARLCFDLAHAHQCDRTMVEAFRILLRFKQRICQLHISELDSAGHRHFPLSYGSIHAFLEVSRLIPATASVIIESLNPFEGAEAKLQRAWIEQESQKACQALGRPQTILPPISSDKASVQSAPVFA